MVAVVLSLAPVADNVHAADHLADSEETDDLSGGHTRHGDLLLAGATDTGQDVGGCYEVGVLQGRGVAERVDQRLEVRLESGQVAAEKVGS